MSITVHSDLGSKPGIYCDKAKAYSMPDKP